MTTEPRDERHVTVQVTMPADAIERMHPEYPPLLDAARQAAAHGEHRAIRFAQADIAVILAGAVITVAASLVGAQPYNNILSTAAVLAFLLLWTEKSFAGRFVSPQTWFESRAVAEATKSLMWRYMMQVAPFNESDAETKYLQALHDTLKSHDELSLDRGHPRLDQRQITPYMRLIRSMPAPERKESYLSLRLNDQLRYYASKAERDRRSGKRWRIVGLVFRGATFACALLRFEFNSVSVLVGLFVNLTIVVASWSQLIRYDELAKSYHQVDRALRKLQRELKRTEDDVSIENLVLETEGVITQENTMWRLKRS